MSSFSAEVHQHRNTSAPRVSVVIPVLNDARNLEVLLPALVARADLHEVALVDGGSVDDTVAVARRLVPGLKIVRQVRHGKGNALAAGLAAVSGDIVVLLDTGLDANPAEIPALVRALVAGADVATGARARGTVLDGAVNAIITLMSGPGWADLRNGCVAFWADLTPLLELPDHRVMTPQAGQMFWGDGIEIEALLACRLAAADVTLTVLPSTRRARWFGRSTPRRPSDAGRIARTLVVEWRRVRAVRRLERAVNRIAPVNWPARPAHRAPTPA